MASVGKWWGYDDMKNEGKRTETRAKESEREGPPSQEVKFGKGGAEGKKLRSKEGGAERKRRRTGAS